MSGLETAALKAGNTIVTQVLRSWLARWKRERRRGAGLAELITAGFGDLGVRDRGRLRRKLEEVADSSGERLQSLGAHEFRDLDDAERAAALEAVVDALDEADLSDAVVLGTDLDAGRLAAEVLRQIPRAAMRAGLGGSGRALFDLVLKHSCAQFCQLLRELPEYESRLGEESLRRLTVALDRIDEILDRVPATTLDAPAGTDHDEEFRRRFLDLTVRHYDDLELIGISVRNFDPRTTLSVAYLSLTVNEEGGRDDQPGADWFDPRHFDLPGGALRVETALSGGSRMLVRGEAGSGKSTLLRWLAVTAARGNFTHELAEWNGSIPVLIKLRSHAGKDLPEPDEFLREQTGPLPGQVPTGWMNRQLDNGTVLLLLDGVDEVSSRQRPKVRAWLRRLLLRYPDVRVVVTSRPAAATAAWLRSDRFASVTLDALFPPDVRVFIEKWHNALLDAAGGAALPWNREQIEEYRRSLLTQLGARPHLRNLAQSPLMCAMLCALHLDRGKNLPRDRKNLYQAALEMLLDRREVERDMTAVHQVDLSYHDKLLLLQDLAFWVSKNGWSEISQEAALSRVARKLKYLPHTRAKPEQTLQYLLERSGVIRAPAEGRVDFVHRTFQEFLAASEAADEGDVGLLVENAHKTQWREIVVMAAGLLQRRERSELLDGLLSRAQSSSKQQRRTLRLVAATCQESVNDLPPRLTDRVHHNIRALVPPNNIRECGSLATVGEALLTSMPRRLEELSNAKAAACVETVSLVNGPRALDLLAAYAKEPRATVQRGLSLAWERFDPAVYAQRVLGESPLHDGLLTVFQRRHLEHLDPISRLKKLSVHFRNPVPDIDWVADLPPLEGFVSVVHGDVPIQRFARHDDLRALQLYRLNRITGLPELARHRKLTSLHLGCRRPIRSADFLTALAELSLVSLNRCTDPKLFERIAQLPRIQYVLVGQYTTQDLAPLAAATELRLLALGHSSAELDLSPLRGKTGLQIRIDERQKVRGTAALAPDAEIVRTRHPT